MAAAAADRRRAHARQDRPLEMDLMALEMLLLRVATQAAGTPGPEASIVKIRGSELQQDIAMLQMEVAGPNGWPYSTDWMELGAPQPVSGRNGRHRLPRPTTTCARPRSTVARPRFRRTSSPR
jgi:hypothetical protein